MTVSEAAIRECFRRDMENPRPAVAPDDIPLSYDLMTPEWLTHILCKDHPGAKVDCFTLSEIDNGSTNRRRVFLTYNVAGQAANLPASVFCKASHALANRISLGLSGAVAGEVAFYNHIRPLLDIDAPVAHFATYDPQSFNSMIMLRDDSDRVTFGGQDTAINRKRAEAMVRLMATYHGAMHENPVIGPQALAIRTWEEQFDSNVAVIQLEKYTNKGFIDAEAVIPPRLFARAAEIWPATVASVRQHARLPRTMMHCDTHLKNWYLTADDGMGLMDWQLICAGHGTRDLAYALAVGLDPADRRLWERDLIALYVETFAEQGGDRMSFDLAWHLYRQQLFAALAWWTITLSPSPELPADMQPRETSLKFIGRITTAIDDLDALDVNVPA